MIANGKGEILTTAFTGPTLKIQMPAAEYLSVARLRGSYSSLLEEQSEDASVSDPTIHILAIAPIAIQDSALGLSWEPEDPDAPKRHTQKPGLTQLKPNSYYLGSRRSRSPRNLRKISPLSRMATVTIRNSC